MDTNKSLSEKIVVGLDIGTTKIATIVGKRNEYGKLDIIGMGKSESVGVMRGVVANIKSTVDSIILSVKEAEENSGITIKEVYVGIAGQHIKSMQQRGSLIRGVDNDNEIEQVDIDKIVQSLEQIAMPSGEEIIHIIPQEFKIDNETGVINPIGRSGSRVEADCHVITGHINAIRDIKKCVERAGLICKGLFLEPLASSDAVLTDEEKEAGVVLVDIGGGTTDIAIFQNNIIRHTAVIPFGGNIISSDIKEGCGIITSQAEQLKIKFGSALATSNAENEVVSIPGLRGRPPKEISVKTLAQIIQARVDEILDSVYYEIKASKFDKKLGCGLVLTGGGAQLRHIRHRAEMMTGLQARIGYPNEHIAKGTDDLKSPMYATSVGLVMKGFQNEDRFKDEIIANTPGDKVVEKVKNPRTDIFGIGTLLDIFFPAEEKDKEIK